MVLSLDCGRFCFSEALFPFMFEFERAGKVLLRKIGIQRARRSSEHELKGRDLQGFRLRVVRVCEFGIVQLPITA